MPNRRFNKQVAPQMKAGGRVKRMGGGMSTRRKDMKSGYYPDDMGMKGGPMMKNGGSGKLKMVTNKEGKKVPFYAADGVGKMKKGGIAKLNPGLKAYMMKKKKKKGKK